MIELNLVPDVKQQLISAQRLRNTVSTFAFLIGAGFLAAVILLGTFVFLAQPALKESAENKIKEDFAKLEEVEDLNKMLTIRNQMAALSSINSQKEVSSRLFNMLTVAVPKEVDSAKLKLDTVTLEQSEEGGDGEGGQPGMTIVLEGRTSGGYAVLEKLEKTLLSTIVQYTKREDKVKVEEGTSSCDSAKGLNCVYLVVGAGESTDALVTSDTAFGEDADGGRSLSFKIKFTVAPEFLSNQSDNVIVKIGRNGNVTDSYLGAPTAVFSTEGNK